MSDNLKKNTTVPGGSFLENTFLKKISQQIVDKRAVIMVAFLAACA